MQTTGAELHSSVNQSIPSSKYTILSLGRGCIFQISCLWNSYWYSLRSFTELRLGSSRLYSIDGVLHASDGGGMGSWCMMGI